MNIVVDFIVKTKCSTRHYFFTLVKYVFNLDLQKWLDQSWSKCSPQGQYVLFYSSYNCNVVCVLLK